MAAPTNLVTIRPGVTLAAPAAASFARAERDWGRHIDVNSSYRDWATQYELWRNYTTTGRRPVALHPDKSMHCKGLAIDTDDHTKRGFIDHMRDHGWVQTATTIGEPWHLDYFPSFDHHKDAPAGGATPTPDPQEDDMTANFGITWTRDDGKKAWAVANTESGYWNSWTKAADASAYALSVGKTFGVTYAPVTALHADNMRKACEAVRPRVTVTVEANDV